MGVFFLYLRDKYVSLISDGTCEHLFVFLPLSCLACKKLQHRQNMIPCFTHPEQKVIKRCVQHINTALYQGINAYIGLKIVHPA